MKSLSAITALLVSALALTSCATRRQAKDIDARLRDMEVRQAAIEESVQRIDSLLTEQTDLVRSLKAQVGVSFSELSDRMYRIEGGLADVGDRQSVVVRKIENRPREAKADSSADSSAVAANPKEIYDAAYLDFVKGNYKLAISGFKEYLEKSPGTSISDNAKFYIGESYFQRKKYSTAIKHFDELIAAYPKSEKVAPAMLRSGEAYLKLKKKSSAARRFRQLIDKFPDSPEAKTAADIIENSGLKSR